MSNLQTWKIVVKPRYVDGDDDDVTRSLYFCAYKAQEGYYDKIGISFRITSCHGHSTTLREVEDAVRGMIVLLGSTYSR